MRWTPAASIATFILGLTAAADMAVAAPPTQDQATGGSEALQCLEKNVASLSRACQKAVNAVKGGAPPALPAPAAAKTPAARHHHQQRLLPHRHNPQPLRQLNLHSRAGCPASGSKECSTQKDSRHNAARRRGAVGQAGSAAGRPRLHAA